MTRILVFALLLPLLFMNFGMSLSRAFARSLGTLASRWVPETAMGTPQVEALRLRLERKLRLAKLAVGVVALDSTGKTPSPPLSPGTGPRTPRGANRSPPMPTSKLTSTSR